jgi:MbtH protein
MRRRGQPGRLGPSCSRGQAKGSTVSNPFEDNSALYKVLVNDEGQYSLWPGSLSVPDGWAVMHDTDSRSNCIEYIEESWTDMRPKSLLRPAAGQA